MDINLGLQDGKVMTLINGAENPEQFLRILKSMRCNGTILPDNTILLAGDKVDLVKCYLKK